MNQRSMDCRMLMVACVAAFVLSARGASAQAVELLPNLEPFPASDVQLVSGPDGVELRFSTTSWNRGVGAFELRGGELVGPDRQNVYQWVRRSDGTFSAPYLIGQFVYHPDPDHSHFHLEDYARYSLEAVDAPGGSGRVGSKVSFCLLDNTKVNTHLPNAAKRPVYTTCNPEVQGLSVGWGDRYGSHLEGQSLPFGLNPSGDYLLKIEIDPARRLHESDASDNVSCVLLRLDASALSAQVIGTSCALPAAVTIASISPNAVAPGFPVSVVITGSGFEPGMAVSFENGSGKVPVASSVTVSSDGTSISATVNVGAGGSRADSVWDLRVGPTVLPDAFTVVR